MLITRKGQVFVDADLREYLDITWAENPLSTINNCVASFYGLMDMLFTGTQSLNALFETELNKNESTLLFRETASFSEPRGLGVWHNPSDGGSHRSDGGQFVFISGRPYRYDAEHLRANIEFILKYLLNESALMDDEHSIGFRLEQNYPNPINTTTTISYFLYDPANVTIRIYDIRGELIEVLLINESKSAGPDDVIWNGKNKRETRVSSGIYFYQLITDESSQTKKMLLLK